MPSVNYNNEITDNRKKCLFYYRYLCNIVWLMTVFIFAFVKSMNGMNIPPLKERSLLYKNAFELSLFIIAVIATIPHFTLYKHTVALLNHNVTNKERSVESLIANKNWSELSEIVLFGTRLTTDQKKVCLIRTQIWNILF